MRKQVSLAAATERSEGQIARIMAAPPGDSSSTVLALIERVALDPRADVEKLDRMMAMYERVKAKEAELAYNAAKGRILKKLVGIKMLMRIKDMPDQDAPRLGELLTADFQELTELLDRRIGNDERCQLFALGVRAASHRPASFLDPGSSPTPQKFATIDSSRGSSGLPVSVELGPISPCRITVSGLLCTLHLRSVQTRPQF